MATRLFQISSRPGEHVSFMQRAQKFELDRRRQQLNEQEQRQRMQFADDLHDIQLTAKEYEKNLLQNRVLEAQEKAKLARDAESKLPEFTGRINSLRNLASYRDENGNVDFDRYNMDYTNLKADMAGYEGSSQALQNMSSDLDRMFNNQSRIYVSSQIADSNMKKKKAAEEAYRDEEYARKIEYAKILRKNGNDALAKTVEDEATANRYGMTLSKIEKKEEPQYPSAFGELNLSSNFNDRVIAEGAIKSAIMGAAGIDPEEPGGMNAKLKGIDDTKMGAIGQMIAEYETKTRTEFDIESFIEDFDAEGWRIPYFGGEKETKENFVSAIRGYAKNFKVEDLNRRAFDTSQDINVRSNYVRDAMKSDLITREQATEMLMQMSRQG